MISLGSNYIVRSRGRRYKIPFFPSIFACSLPLFNTTNTVFGKKKGLFLKFDILEYSRIHLSQFQSEMSCDNTLALVSALLQSLGGAEGGEGSAGEGGEGNFC